jgi:hypothetical protein
MLGEPPPRFAHRVGGRANALADVLVLRALRGQKDNARCCAKPCAVFRRDARHIFASQDIKRPNDQHELRSEITVRRGLSQ